MLFTAVGVSHDDHDFVLLNLCHKPIRTITAGTARAAANIALSAIDNTETHTDNAPSVMNAMAIAARARNIQTM